MALKKRSKIILIVVSVIAVGAIAASFSLSDSNNDMTLIQAELAYIDDITEVVTASGRIQPQTQVEVTAEISAQIINLFVKEGDQTTTGQRMLLLDTIQLKADVEQARYTLDEITSRKDAAFALYRKDSINFKRQTKLFEQRLASETEYNDIRFTFDNSRANFHAMLAQVKTSRARLEKTKDNLTKTLIKAPMAGTITYLNVEVGEIAQAQTAFTQGQTLLTISDLSVFEVEVDVDETEIAKVVAGQKVDIRVDAFRDTIFPGTIVEISNPAKVSGQGTDNFSTTFRVKVRFNEANIPVRPGMSATVDITTQVDHDALLIPYAAVLTREFDPDSVVKNNSDVNTENEEKSSPYTKKKSKIKKTGVFVINDGVAKFVELTTGIADERNLVALTGLTPGDTVISGSFQTLRKLKEGDLVKIEDASLEKMKENES